MSQLVQNKQWKHTAIQRSETITDLWDVIKVYLGRGAVVILFICMIGDVIQVLPGGLLQQWVISTILGVQIVTIDVAGFGLQSIAENARLNGDEKGYKKAMYTSYALISIMMITLFLLTTAQIWPDTKGVVSIANDALILVRVGMTVLYGHIVHSLGKSQHHLIPAHVADDLQHQLERMQHEHEATIRRLETETRNERTRLEKHYESVLENTKALLEQQQHQRITDAIEDIKQQVSRGAFESISGAFENASKSGLVLLKADESGVEAPIHESTITLDGKQHEAAFKSVSEADRNAIREAHKRRYIKTEYPLSYP